MAVTFNQFSFENRNGIPVTLRLEAPVGTPIISVTVQANDSYSTNPNRTDVPSGKITVTAQGHEEFPDKELITLTGSPYGAFLETLITHSSIGSVHGTLTARF